MRVLLVNPHYPVSETPSPPLGLAFLAASLERSGVEVALLDFVVFPYSRAFLEAEMRRVRPDMVGITAVTMTYDHAAGVVRDVKAIDARVTTVMGGPHVTFRAEETLRELPELDLVSLGEGDRAVVELVSALEKGTGWRDVKGLVYRDGSDILRSEPRRALEDVNQLPVPARHVLPLGRYRALGMPITMTTSRGCPHQCIFCVGRKMVGSKVRYRKPESVVDEMEQLNRLGFHQINVADDLFTANPRHCLAVCDGILKRRLDVKWTAFSRVDTVSREMLGKMREAGCHTVSFGVESANPEILRRIRKRITPEQVVEAVRMAVDAGVTPHASFILGLPGETPETMKETAEFGERIKSMGAIYGFHLLAPFPGTEVRDQCETHGIRILTSDWREYHANRAIVETPDVTRGMMDDVVSKWQKEFDDWLEYVRLRRETGEATEEEAWPLTRLEHTIVMYELMMERIVEEKGAWRNGGRPETRDEALGRLADAVVSSTKHSQDQVLRTLRFAADGGNLRYSADNGRSRWEWVDYL